MRLRIVLVCSIVTALAGCGSSSSTHVGLSVVASTNVYGDIARQIGGARVHVTSILTSPDADPHLFEPGTANGLAVAEADVVIQNGAGYDTFMTKLENAAPSSKRRVLTVADLLGAQGHDVNPHFWYDTPQLPLIARSIAATLAQADPPHAAAYRRGARRFIVSLTPLDRAVAAIRRAHTGDPVAYTEPVPGYLLSAAGLRNVSPSGFTRAIENGSEPSPTDVAAMSGLLTEHTVKVLLYNSQAISPITSTVRKEATAQGIPVVAVTETLPADRTFQQWQLEQVRALERALSR